jgi:hypothetical protein
MKIEAIENCFNDDFKKQSFLCKLKQCGENSEEVTLVSNLIKKFRINKPPRGVQQTTY